MKCIRIIQSKNASRLSESHGMDEHPLEGPTVGASRWTLPLGSRTAMGHEQHHDSRFPTVEQTLKEAKTPIQ
jgi:hypothetical protein